ncbi:MAG: hypothetical protein IJR99_12720 [Kiritimatiellae bacterium]|nr:hypothetical protein [Kiritimatiellia bacterium]
MLSIAVALNANADIDLSTLDYSTSAASAGRHLELREEGTVGHALVNGTEYKGDPAGGAASAWNTASLATGWQTFTSGTNTAAILKLDPQSTAIEGGRLQSNTTWDNSKTHVVRNWVTVPDGVTLTISQGAIVKFCEGTGIKVLSGGRVEINGAEGADVVFASIGNDTYGGDTNLRDGDFATNSYEIVTLNGGLWSDNGYWVTPDAQLRGYPEVTLHDSLASISDGVARVPVTVSGTRNAPFSIDWALEGASPLATATSGTLSWTGSDEGTKYIEIPLKSTYVPSGVETFTLRLTLARSVTRANETCEVKVFKGGIDVASLEYSTSAASAGRRLELRAEGTVGHALVSNTEYKGDPAGGTASAWNTASLSTGWQTLTSGTNTAAILKLDSQTTAIEGGRLQSNTTWTSDKAHVVRNWVTVPDGVTLTITEGTIVKFCEMAGIKVLSGGKVQINGAEGADVFFASIGNDSYGGDTNLRDGDFATNSYEIVTLNGGLWSDNGYWVTPDAAVRPYPEVELHDAIVAIESGVVRIPVSVSGTRNAPFSIDWAVSDATSASLPFSSTSGTLSWTGTSEGTKYIEIPLKSTYTPNGTEAFALSATRARSVKLANDAAIVRIYNGRISVSDVIENGESTPSAGTFIETRGLGGTLIAKEQEPITYSPRWGNAVSCEVAVDGTRLLSNAVDSGSLSWTRPETPGLYRFTHAAGDETLTARFAVLDDNVILHDGMIVADETWTADITHLVTDTVTVKNGTTLTIAPGTIVKFMDGSGIVCEAGGQCIADGVIFTHASDDTVGGDTLQDGNLSMPVADMYVLNGVSGNDATQYRYHPDPTVTLRGTISRNEVWRGYNVYCVTGDVTVASGVTLTIEPGAVVKFAENKALTVNSGATLSAIGTRAQPIVFTSIKDDEFGGDTNGDGEKTRPAGGDWRYIYVSGTANLKYCKAMYAAPSNETGILETSGSGALNMDCCFVGYALYDGIWNWGGTISVKNTIISDTGWATAPYRGSKNEYVNCIFFQNSVGVCYWSNWNGNPVYRNCIFAECGYGWCELNSGTYGDPSSRFTTANCLFWNPVEIGSQSCGLVGSNGNIWGDPLFVDAENGDFRIQKGSPCVNAGDAANAPEYDYYGQPRDDGAPDIGIYEIVGGMSANDLAADAINCVPPVAGGSQLAATVGDTLTISYDVANVGKQAIDGSWRDKVSLVSADGGYSLDLGIIVQSASLAVGATNTFSALFTVPPEAEGTWRVQVGINVERDIYEGANVTNNIATSAGTVEISLPARAAADGFSGTSKKGMPASAKFALDGTEPMVARINAPAGTVVYLGSGFMPSASSYSARAVVGADGGLIGIPAGVTTAYLLVETTSASGAAFSMTLESAALAVQSVSPATLPYTGTTGLVIDGANFAEGCTVVVERAASAFGTGEPPVLQSSVVSPTRMTAQIDCSRLTAGATYDVKMVGADGATATLPAAVTVANIPAAPKLTATLDAPASVRRGRTLTVYIDYENTGNADMPAPVFELISQGQVFKIDGAVYTNSVKVMGLSAEAPVGTLRPGEPQRLAIPVTILAENVKWKLRSYHAAQEGAKSAKFSLRELYDDDWVLYHVADDDATVAKLRTVIGSTYAAFYTNLGTWLGTVEPQTTDYETLKSAFGRYQYLKAAGMLDAGDESHAETAENAEAGGTSSSDITGRGTIKLQGTKGDGGCGTHYLTCTKNSNAWKEYPRDGSVWKWCSACSRWALAVREENNIYSVCTGEAIDPNQVTYIICHGNDNNISTDWIVETAKALSGKGNVLAVNWGDGARVMFGVNPGTASKYFKGSAQNIPRTVNEAKRNLEKMGIVPSNTMLIGHSHGAHVAANIMTYWNGTGVFNRFIGLDTSTTDNGVHTFNTMPPSEWIRVIRLLCGQVEFYKSSFDMSLEETGEMYGHYNFALIRKGDFHEWYLGAMQLWGLSKNGELNRHSWAHQWFLKTIKQPLAYRNLGFNFTGYPGSWHSLAGNDMTMPGNSVFAGLIRDNVLEFLDCRELAGQRRTPWRYLSTAIADQTVSVDGKSLRALKQAWNITADVEVDATIPDKIDGGMELKVSIINLADNLSVDYSELFSNTREWHPLLCKEHGTVTAWLVDLQGLEDEGLPTSFSNITNLVDTLAQSGDPTKFYKKIGEVVCEYPRPCGNAQKESIKLDIPEDLFGADRPLAWKENEGDTEYEYRKVLMVLSAGNVVGFSSLSQLPRHDLYWTNNFIMQNVNAEPSGVHAIISKSVPKRKAASLKSARLLVAVPTHQLSENALKPGGVVTVYANSDGVWSINLDASESYTTDDEEDITVNRFELIDTAGKQGTVAMRMTDFGSGNDYQQLDFPWVTVHGQLPTTTDADGNLVCEGEQYTVQLTVASSGEEDDVTTCVLDVRYDPEHDDGEDEDDDSSKEPKSCDPNAVEGDEGVGEARLVKSGQELTYTIFFENKSDADAAAACVEVFNPLSDALDWSSLTMLDVGYNNNVDNGLSGLHEGWSEKQLEGTNTSVKTEFAVDEETGVAQWYLRIIDPNGDSEGWPTDMTGGFLPPNNDTHCGEGYVRYRIKVRDDAPANTIITNSATIIFDHYNDPIETDPAWWNTVAAMAQVKINVNGVTTNLTLIVGQPFGVLPTPKPRDGVVFGGWFTGPDGTGQRVTATSIVPAGLTGLYAYWIAIAPEYALHDAPVYGGLSSAYKGCTYNGYALDGDGVIAGTFSLAVKKPAKGKTTSAATLTFVPLSTGKKTKVTGTVNLVTGAGGGGLAGLTLGANAVGGTVAKVGTLEGGADAAKAKDAAALSVLSKFSGKSYVLALGPENADAFAQGGYSTLAVTMAAKGKAKVSGVLADGTKVTAAGMMTVGDAYCCVPVIYAKKSKFGFVAWFDRNSRQLVDVTALTPWKNTVKPAFTMAWEVQGIGAKGNVAAGTRTVELDDVKLSGLVPGAVAQTPFDIPLKVSGTKWDAGKAAKVAYKGGTVTVAGANVSGLKLTYTAKTGLFKGSFVVYAVKGGKLVKNKFSVFGAVTGGVGFGTAVLKGKGSVSLLVQ